MSASNPASRKPAPMASGGSDVESAYRKHRAWLVAFLRRRFDPQVAEDLAQETFVRATAAGVELRNPRAFLAKAAVHAARDAARRQAARPRLAPEAADAAAPGDQAETVLLKQVILSLPPRLREVFLLSRFGGLTYEEIAHRCGVSVKTVEARMTKALAMCTARMRD